MDDSIRTFIAIELDPATQRHLQIIQEDLRQIGADVKWVKPKNIHLTLKFMGNVHLNQIAAIAKAIKECLRNTHKFTIELSHLGAFPQIENPRVVWVGLKNGQKESMAIATSLETHLEKLGIKKEIREFDPHITIGRLRSSRKKGALVKAIKSYSFKSTMIQPVTHVTLFKSTLTSQGPIYEILEKVSVNPDKHD